MAARRLIVVMLVLLVLSSILAALVPVERNRSSDSSNSTSSSQGSTVASDARLIRRTIATDDPTPERIALRPGDQLELTVSSPKLDDQVEIPAFGNFEDVSPDFPARFDLLALEPGSFAVRLVEADRVIARIDVAGQGAQRGPDGAGSGGSSSDSPGSSTAASTPGADSRI